MTTTFAQMRVVPALCAWAGFFAAYLIFAGDVSADEIVAGVICSAAAVAWWLATRRASEHAFVFDFDALVAIGRACRKLPRATLCVAAVLLRALVGREAGAVARWRYPHGRLLEPADEGRRAVGVLAASFAPDSFVLRTPGDRDEIVVHGLPRSEPPTDPKWPI